MENENINQKLDPVWDLPIKEGLKCAEELRTQVSVGRNEYLLNPVFSNNCRDYLVFTALDEIQKTSVHLMRLRELLDEPNVEHRTKKGSRIELIVTSSVLEEQQMRIRRLLELLVILILFTTTNKIPYYRHFLLLEELDQNLSENSDRLEFWGQQSQQITFRLERIVEQIRKVESEIDIDKCWYLQDRRSIQEKTKLRAGRVFNSFRSRIKTAYQYMSSTERVVAGYTYYWVYGCLSEDIHYRANQSDLQVHPNELMLNVQRMGLLIYLIIDRCYCILDKPVSPRFKVISESLIHSSQANYLEAATVKNAVIGDFVSVTGEVAEIVDTEESKYGYKTYKVRYVSPMPQTIVVEDWIPAPYIQMFYPRQRFLEVWNSYLQSQKVPEEFKPLLNNLPIEQLNRAFRQAISDVWNATYRVRLTKFDSELGDHDQR